MPTGRSFLHLGLILLTLAAPLRADSSNAAPIDPATFTAPTNQPPAILDATPPPVPTQSQYYAPAAGQAPGQPAANPEEDISDIRPPVFSAFSFFWLWIALIAGGVIALLLLLWNKYKPERQLSAKSAYELTLEKLNLARELMREDEPVPYAVFVSETIRNYLGQRFQTPSTRRTTEEFLRLMEADPNTPLAEHRDLLRQFLQSCDLVKFAKYQPTLEELEQVQQSAVSFVTATKPVIEGTKGGRR